MYPWLETVEMFMRVRGVRIELVCVWACYWRLSELYSCPPLTSTECLSSPDKTRWSDWTSPPHCLTPLATRENQTQLDRTQSEEVKSGEINRLRGEYWSADNMDCYTRFAKLLLCLFNFAFFVSISLYWAGVSFYSIKCQFRSSGVSSSLSDSGSSRINITFSESQELTPS